MEIVSTDTVLKVPPGTTPNYDQNNPLLKLLKLMENVQLAAEREYYLMEHANYLFPFDSLKLYGPAQPDSDQLDPRYQDNKTNFQKQNVQDFFTSDTFLVRGYARVDNWTGPFLRISYRGGPDSQLSKATGHDLGSSIKLWLKVGNASLGGNEFLKVPYNPISHRYEIEIWGYPYNNLRTRLDSKGQRSFDCGELIARTDLVQGSISDFERGNIPNDSSMFNAYPEHTMHPILPLPIELAWADSSEQFWDSHYGNNYRYVFSMIIRGWDNYLKVGMSKNPHGGVGFLEYRNLLSNYPPFDHSNELDRTLEYWNFDAYGNKSHDSAQEKFMAIDYIDMHILKANCGIGLHRHRDNQEIFMMLDGQGFMAVGDWCKIPDRERCIEIRTLQAGHFSILKSGNLHALMNPSDEDMTLLMFGGYD